MGDPTGNEGNLKRSRKIQIVVTPVQFERIQAIRQHLADERGAKPSIGGVIYEFAMPAITRKYEKLTAEAAVA